MFEKEAKKHKEEFIAAYISVGGGLKAADMLGVQKEQSYKDGAELGYNLGKKGNKPAYIKGMRTLANALKEYDRTFGAWTDYFEHTVDKVLKQELEKV